VDEEKRNGGYAASAGPPMRAGLLMLIAFACATAHGVPIAPETDTCGTTADCEVTTFTSCCGCEAEPRAVNRKRLAERREICAVVECKCAGDCRCPAVTGARMFQAACVQGHCTAAPR
jgi:hypothetical protein